MNLHIIYNRGILGDLKKLKFDHTSFILNYINSVWDYDGEGSRESIIHLIFDSDVTTLRAVINNPFYTRAPSNKRSCCLPLRFLRPSKSHPTGGVSDKLEETRAHAVYIYRVRRTSSVVFNSIRLTFTIGMLLYPVCTATTKTAAHTAPHRLDNQIRFLPTLLQTRHYAQTEFPLHFVPETTFHPFRNRETYLFIFLFSHPQFSFSRHYTLS